jgi:hypothetical protein
LPVSLLLTVSHRLLATDISTAHELFYVAVALHPPFHRSCIRKDVSHPGSNAMISMRWAGHTPSNEIDGLTRILVVVVVLASFAA